MMAFVLPLKEGGDQARIEAETCLVSRFIFEFHSYYKCFMGQFVYLMKTFPEGTEFA